MTTPQIVILAGPNGAGKSSSAPAILRDTLRVITFVNADEIARGLAGFDPDGAAIEAGRIMLDRLRRLMTDRVDFAFETTLAGRGMLQVLRRALDSGYRVHLVYLWLPSAEVAVARVRERVRAGGHDVPAEVVRRRYARSVMNFDRLYRPVASSWYVYDSGASSLARLVAYGANGTEATVVDATRWRALREQVVAFSHNTADNREETP